MAKYKRLSKYSEGSDKEKEDKQALVTGGFKKRNNFLREPATNAASMATNLFIAMVMTQRTTEERGTTKDSMVNAIFAAFTDTESLNAERRKHKETAKLQMLQQKRKL